MHKNLLDQNFLNNCLQETIKKNDEEEIISEMKYWISVGADPEFENNYILRKSAKRNKRKIINYLIEECKIQVTFNTKDWLRKNCDRNIIIYIEEKSLQSLLNLNQQEIKIVKKNKI